MKKETQERILAGAFRLFLENNYEKVSARELEQATGLTRGAIYYYSKDKNGLFRDVINKYILEKQDIKNRMGTRNIDEISLFDFLNDYVDCIDRNISSMRLLVKDESKADGAYFHLLYQAQINYEGFSELISKIFEEERRILEKVIRNAISRGEINPNFNPVELSFHLRYIFLGNSFEASLKTGVRINELRAFLLYYYKLIKI